MDASDWRSELHPHARKRAVQQIMNAVKLCNHLDNEEGMQELEKFSQSFEQKTFAGATSQSDYLQKISSKEVSVTRIMQEEAYQKIEMLKEMYLPEMEEIQKKVVNKLQQLDSLPQQAKSGMYQKLKMFKVMVQRLIAFLKISQSNIHPRLSVKLPSYEKQIINFINVNRRKGRQIANKHTSSRAQ